MKKVIVAMLFVCLCLNGCASKGLDPVLTEISLAGLRTNHERLAQQHETDQIKVDFVLKTWTQVFKNIEKAKGGDGK